MNIERIKIRLSEKSPDTVEQIIYILDKYNLSFSIRNFDQCGVFLRDEQNRKLRVFNGDKRNDFIHIPVFNGDVAIIFVEGLLCGWTEKEKMDNLEDRMSISVKSLHKMPTTFVFNHQCPHMHVYGGFYEGEFWECVGCGERLVFNDN
jgi:hypothetical protein